MGSLKNQMVLPVTCWKGSLNKRMVLSGTLNKGFNWKSNIHRPKGVYVYGHHYSITFLTVKLNRGSTKNRQEPFFLRVLCFKIA